MNIATIKIWKPLKWADHRVAVASRMKQRIAEITMSANDEIQQRYNLQQFNAKILKNIHSNTFIQITDENNM